MQIADQALKTRPEPTRRGAAGVWTLPNWETMTRSGARGAPTHPASVREHEPYSLDRFYELGASGCRASFATSAVRSSGFTGLPRCIEKPVLSALSLSARRV